MKTYHIFFSKLANPLKTSILELLKEKPNLSVSQISNQLKIEQSKLSHALAALRKCNIVQTTKQGKNRLYNLNKNTILPLLKLVDKHEKKYCKECWARKKKLKSLHTIFILLSPYLSSFLSYLPSIT